MTDPILEIAAYVALGIGVGVVLYLALGARARRRFAMWRFDRKVHQLDGVPDQGVAEWAGERRDDHPSGDTLPRPRRLHDEY